MNRNDMRYSQYVSILKEELVPAMGCTEPIAIAYGASIAAGVLEQLPQKVLIEASGSIIKNVKSVIVPNTHHLKGMSAAAASGIIAGDPSRKLEVISDVCEEKKCQIEQFLNTAVFEEKFLDSGYNSGFADSIFKTVSLCSLSDRCTFRRIARLFIGMVICTDFQKVRW